MKGWLALLDLVLLGSYCSYILSGLILLLTRSLGGSRMAAVRAPFNTVWKWNKYPALAYVMLDPALRIILFGHLKPMDCLFAVVNGGVWWLYKDAGDDDWKKKLKDKVTGIVTALRGKLVVVPRPQGA